MNTVIDIQNNMVIYNETKINVIIDDNNRPWFSGLSISNILEYKNSRDALDDHVDIQDKKPFSELRKFLDQIPPNSQPHAVYINESGLYSLILSSKMPKAKEFKQWVTSRVLPSIRITGSYSLDEKTKLNVKKLNDKLRKANRTIKALKNNHPKKNLPKGGVMYIVRPIDATNKKMLKPGHSGNLKDRLHKYNTSVPNNMELLFVIEVDDPVMVENCMKAILKPYLYRKKKEYYECDLSKVEDVIKGCKVLSEGDFFCNGCDNKVTSSKHLIKDHKLGKNDKVFVHSARLQSGGNEDELTVLLNEIMNENNLSHSELKNCLDIAEEKENVRYCFYNIYTNEYEGNYQSTPFYYFTQISL